MDRKLILLAALLLACACNPIKNDLEKYSLNCIAKQIILQSDTLERPYTVTFNKYGQVEEHRTFNFDGSFRYQETYSYNDKHQLVEILGLNADNENEARYEYDYKGRFISECRIYGMNNQEMGRWEHQNNGRHIVKTDYYDEGELSYTSIKDYTGKHYVERSYTPDGDLIATANVDFLTDDKFTRIESPTIDVEIEYNPKALPVKSRGTLINSTGEMLWHFDLEEHPFRYYSYEYDERGNWISRAESVHPDSTAYCVLRRIITY